MSQQQKDISNIVAANNNRMQHVAWEEGHEYVTSGVRLFLDYGEWAETRG
jgi:hypothetical protein